MGIRPSNFFLGEKGICQKLMEEFYTQIFENHPQVTAITNWDFND